MQQINDYLHYLELGASNNLFKEGVGIHRLLPWSQQRLQWI